MTLKKGDQLTLANWDDGMVYEVVTNPKTKPDPNEEYPLIFVVLRETDRQ